MFSCFPRSVIKNNTAAIITALIMICGKRSRSNMSAAASANGFSPRSGTNTMMCSISHTPPKPEKSKIVLYVKVMRSYFCRRIKTIPAQTIPEKKVAAEQPSAVHPPTVYRYTLPISPTMIPGRGPSSAVATTTTPVLIFASAFPTWIPRTEAKIFKIEKTNVNPIAAINSACVFV